MCLTMPAGSKLGIAVGTFEGLIAGVDAGVDHVGTFRGKHGRADTALVPLTPGVGPDVRLKSALHRKALRADVAPVATEARLRFLASVESQKSV